ncbi:hypothetical protein CPB84DRAFT_1671701 [Gymnopilus junonius]|uniref:Signal recognition particle subunit SRP72 n=1 Tax=Gymnopilus junonius TaxID=109634 RepID=A0A9P5NWN7_GYMJU|nr:hypothetical protein CPB84DRAFT_1671701 [Gymnopilus junonius]
MPTKSSAKSGTKPPSLPQKPSWKDHKATPKQPLPPQERLKRLFTSLCAQIDDGHFSNAVKTCDKILRLDPKDVDARQTKLFLLLQTEQYNAALSLIDEDDDPSHHAYDRAYTLYRLQRESDARDVLDTIKKEKGEDDRGIVHLEAQLNYREGSYQAAVDLYNELLDTAEPSSEEHSDILTNLQAAQKHLDFINTGFLRALDALPSSVTSTLETAPPPVPPQSAAAALSSVSALAEVQAQTALNPTKKPRKSRIPPGVIPGVTPPPDPERWLKKSERSTFGQGRRRKGQGGGGGGGATQGSAVENVPAQQASASAGHAKSGGGGKGKKKK